MDTRIGTAEFPAPSSETLAFHAYRQLRRDILNGVIAPGEKLRIKVVCEQYGFGGSPIREALTRLAAEGLVTQQQQKGFQVAAVGLDDLIELTRTRCLINKTLVPESLSRGDLAWEEQVVMAHHRMGRVPSRMPDGINPEWAMLHRAFHTSVLAACGSRALLALAESLFDHAELYRNLAWTVSSSRDVASEHRGIMEAAIKRDIPTTIRLLNEHIIATSDLVIASGVVVGATKSPDWARILPTDAIYA